ncbi:hypothetical protein ENBRE01_0830 [Enteropsectra breve]|nr:hypothetical protein ENBRE01_0830 [Enteropsectra breve]
MLLENTVKMLFVVKQVIAYQGYPGRGRGSRGRGSKPNSSRGYHQSNDRRPCFFATDSAVDRFNNNKKHENKTSLVAKDVRRNKNRQRKNERVAGPAESKIEPSVEMSESTQQLLREANPHIANFCSLNLTDSVVGLPGTSDTSHASTSYSGASYALGDVPQRDNFGKDVESEALADIEAQSTAQLSCASEKTIPLEKTLQGNELNSGLEQLCESEVLDADDSWDAILQAVFRSEEKLRAKEKEAYNEISLADELNEAEAESRAKITETASNMEVFAEPETSTDEPKFNEEAGISIEESWDDVKDNDEAESNIGVETNDVAEVKADVNIEESWDDDVEINIGLETNDVAEVKADVNIEESWDDVKDNDDVEINIAEMWKDEINKGSNKVEINDEAEVNIGELWNYEITRGSEEIKIDDDVKINIGELWDDEIKTGNDDADINIGEMREDAIKTGSDKVEINSSELWDANEGEINSQVQANVQDSRNDVSEVKETDEVYAGIEESWDADNEAYAVIEESWDVDNEVYAGTGEPWDEFKVMTRNEAENNFEENNITVTNSNDLVINNNEDMCIEQLWDADDVKSDVTLWYEADEMSNDIDNIKASDELITSAEGMWNAVEVKSNFPELWCEAVEAKILAECDKSRSVSTENVQINDLEDFLEPNVTKGVTIAATKRDNGKRTEHLKNTCKVKGSRSHIKNFTRSYRTANTATLNKNLNTNCGKDGLYELKYVSPIQDPYSAVKDSSKVVEDLNKTVKDLNEVVQGSTEVAKGYGEAVEDLNKTVKDLNEVVQGSTEVAKGYGEAVKDSTKAVEDLNKTVKDLSKIVKGSTEAAKNFGEAVKESTEVVKKLYKTANDFNESVESIEVNASANNIVISKKMKFEESSKKADIKAKINVKEGSSVATKVKMQECDKYTMAEASAASKKQNATKKSAPQERDDVLLALTGAKKRSSPGAVKYSKAEEVTPAFASCCYGAGCNICKIKDITEEQAPRRTVSFNDSSSIQPKTVSRATVVVQSKKDKKSAKAGSGLGFCAYLPLMTATSFLVAVWIWHLRSK